MKLLFVFLDASERSTFEPVPPTVTLDNVVSREKPNVFSFSVTFSFFVSEIDASKADRVADLKILDTVLESSDDSEFGIWDVLSFRSVVSPGIFAAFLDFSFAESSLRDGMISVNS